MVPMCIFLIAMMAAEGCNKTRGEIEKSDKMPVVEGSNEKKDGTHTHIVLKMTVLNKIKKP